MTMQERLILLRKRHNLTLAELAARSDVPSNTLYCYEQGIRSAEGMSIAVGKRLAQAYHVSLDYLSGMYDEEGRGQEP